MTKSTLSVGDPIEARCTKCRKNRNHVIVSISDEGPDNVQCKTCEHQHKYKPPTISKTPAEKAAIRTKEAECIQSAAERKKWKALLPGMDSAKAQIYSMTASYKVNALIMHPVFGLGQVQRLLGAQKVEILFEDGKKTMRCK
nr:hypothetical protein [uncultured Desulfuromonas sp.]